jgi:hypothetical protein
MSQREQILAALKRGEALSPMDALLRYGCFRLAARICDLRTEGFQIDTELVTEPKTFARYKLKEASL